LFFVTIVSVLRGHLRTPEPKRPSSSLDAKMEPFLNRLELSASQQQRAIEHVR
jgi:hypothetical protein